MPTALLLPAPKFRAVDNNGNALSGGLAFFYAAGTTSLVATYTDSTQATQNPNPVVLSTRGEANVWLAAGQNVKLTLSPSTDTNPPTNPIWTVDQIAPAPTVSAAMAPVVAAATVGAALTLLGGAGLVTNTFTGAQTLSSATAGASVEEDLILLRNKGAGVANDFGEALAFAGENASTAQKTFARLYHQIVTATAAAEDGQLIFDTQNAGTLATRATLFKGLQLGAPTGGDKGLGTLNLVGLYLNGASIGALPGYWGGLGLSNDAGASTTTMDIAAGAAVSSDGTTVMPIAAFTKTTASWAVGSGNGALDTGAIGNSSPYAIYLIQRPDTGVVDVLFSLSFTAPSLPTSYTKKRYIGAFLTDSSAHILPAFYLGNYCRLKTPILDASNVTLNAAYATLTLSAPPGVLASGNILTLSGTAGYLQIRPVGAADAAASANGTPLALLGAIGAADVFGKWQVMTSSAAGISWDAHADNTTGNYLTTEGWFDNLGR